MSDISPNGADCLPVVVSTDPPASGPALRVYGYRTVAAAQADGKTILGFDEAQRVYIITAGEVDTIGVQGNVPIPVIIPPDGRPANGSAAPIPVYVVNPVDWP
jgi:hypothetical protein